ncbi:probable RNA helicase armi [Ostrinia furnacalis]|uniref:probable RNA helicase armi n=1 Tax=Ostrinia furnacalis TaxID=93504 RepID=UPI0010402F5D|nr:probable RNA helicase armi [Ostrinia furnacalis]XP_028158763.1 probable RNA helicase armi [Ostrinia furnacalis]
MISYIKSFFSYLFYKPVEEADDDEKENFLAEQLVDLEAVNEEYTWNEESATDIPRDAVCFQRTGIVTYLDGSNYILIDGMLYYDLSSTLITVRVNDKVLYLAYTDKNERNVVVRLLENQGLSWADDECTEQDSFKVINHVIIGEVDYRQERLVYIKDSDLKFNLDNVEGIFVPVKGDWLEMSCRIQFDEKKPCDIGSAQVLEVISFKPVRSKIKNAMITAWFGDNGICDRLIYFDKSCLDNFIEPQVGSKVMVKIIESNQGACTWRAIELIITETKLSDNEEVSDNVPNEEEKSIALEKEKNMEITYPLKFHNLNIKNTAEIKMNVTNHGNEVQFINKLIILSKKRDSQINIEPFLTRPKRLLPKETFTFTITCIPKFLGNTKEAFVIACKGFQARRIIDITVVNENVSINTKNAMYNNHMYKTDKEKIESMKNVRKQENQHILPGVRPVKPPAFIAVKLGSFPIPEKVWSVILGDSEQTALSADYHKVITRIEDKLPCLSQELNIHNYTDKWHNLLYIEEIQHNLNMRAYDRQKVFLIRCQEYLAYEINGLAEQRPSLMKGDKVVVKDGWDTSAPLYEGYIHVIKGDMVLMKFHQRFHEIYSGSDVSIQFNSGRATFRRGHQAVNLAISNLGPSILFPGRISPRPRQVSKEIVAGIKWFNNDLNLGQKTAVTNILLGECRPLPYIVFGPPGTGKTVTVIETILQILQTLPDSRILVATPSNSAADLITQRLIKYREKFSDSVVRIIANHLAESDKVPDNIKPFCATLDIAREETSKSKYSVKDGLNLNCQSSFIGRHRVTVGTCFCIGTLALMGLPKGHFTHVIVDEAGQATEPEIMIPMTFVDKENCQIILAGDPMQLGPVIMSKYCLEFGMDESYLSRILKTFPYQKDYAAFSNGYDPRLITRLTDNYRSLEEVLTLPSEMFYDSSLVAQIDRNETWILNILEVVNEIFHRDDVSTGGIYVYGIKGNNMRAEDSPSWYNPQEASMVALTTCKLYKKHLTVDDIGIITPYVAQIKYLRLVFEAMGLPQPKIGTVEDFQGQERKLILISTVRSTENLVAEDLRFTLGFVNNPKRLNVALTRGQVAVLLFCNPRLLRRDVSWNKVITCSVNEDRYMGCDLPEVVKCKNQIEI